MCLAKHLYKIATDEYRGMAFLPVKAFLSVLSVIYRVIVKILAGIYGLKPLQPACKVISVGNITLGGTGKTVLVELIAYYLKQNSHKVAVLTRGYKRNIKNPSDGAGQEYDGMGDEPYMLKRKLGNIPVLVDKNRVRSLNLAVKKFGVDTVILDDGLQQWRIKKDLEITLIDSVRALGNKKILPRGILREPLSALKRSDIFVLTKADSSKATEEISAFLNKINPKAQIFLSKHEPTGLYDLRNPGAVLGLNVFAGKKAVLFCGIADPDYFKKTVEGLDINIIKSFEFIDHYRYSQPNLDNIIDFALKEKADLVVTTEKDASRLDKLKIPQEGGLPIMALVVKFKITQNEYGFYNRLLSIYPG
ncbi:tetraacyldisaccharide 4'-kinase [bacterium]|nr:MAG: tetraacyldisaccharide 4'-kinase [bacterium]